MLESSSIFSPSLVLKTSHFLFEFRLDTPAARPFRISLHRGMNGKDLLNLCLTPWQGLENELREPPCVQEQKPQCLGVSFKCIPCTL